MSGVLTESKASEIAASLEQHWAACTLANDIDGMLTIFTDDVVFLGSLPTIFLGLEGVRKYLEAVNLSSTRAVTYQDRVVRVLAPNIFTSLSHVVFDAEVGGKVLPFRCAFSWTVVNDGDAWKIAAQHASTRPAQ